MDLTKVSITQVAALVGAVGTIIGAALTIDARYAKQSEIADVKKEIQVSLDKLHQQILENEQLREELGHDAKATKLIADRNRMELAEIRERLSRENRVYKSVKPSSAPIRIEQEKVEQ